MSHKDSTFQNIDAPEWERLMAHVQAVAAASHPFSIVQVANKYVVKDDKGKTFGSFDSEAEATRLLNELIAEYVVTKLPE